VKEKEKGRKEWQSRDDREDKEILEKEKSKLGYVGVWVGCCGYGLL